MNPAGAMDVGGEMMMGMMQVQMALQKCNIGPIQEEMIMDSITAGGDVKTKVSLPNDKVDRKDIEQKVEKAVKALQSEQWTVFGAQLGGMMRKLVVIAFPQKYAVDDFGSLKKLIGQSDSTKLGGLMSHFSGMSPLFFTPLLLVLLFAAGRRASRSHALMVATEEEARCGSRGREPDRC